MSTLQERAYEALRQVEDPEAGINIVDLGLVYEIRGDAERLELVMTFTSEACPAGPVIAQAAEDALAGLAEKPQVTVTVTFDPPWTIQRITRKGRELLAMRRS
jgi:metal-sulfur cluster biosynthetic enzyme